MRKLNRLAIRQKLEVNLPIGDEGLRPADENQHVAVRRKRRPRSFSSALLMMRSSSGGRSGLTRMGAVGARFRTESKTTAEVLPLKGTVPVAISYSTAPKENRSVRASKSSPRACSGDM